MGQHRTFSASDGAQLPIYRAAPAAPSPGLVVFPSIFGVTPELQAHVDDIAAGGALVVAFDPFARGDAGPVSESESARAFARVQSLDRKRANLDLRELIDAVRADAACNGKVAVLGICLGGPFMWLAAADGIIDAGAAWHGSRIGQFLDAAADIRCPVALDYGDEDPVAPLAEIESIRAACTGMANIEIRVHPGAGHGFSHTGWQAFRPEAAAAGRQAVDRILAGLREPT